MKISEYTYSEARKNLSSILNTVCYDHVPIYIKRKNGEKAVIISAEEYESMDETHYLLKNEANKKHILDSIKQANNEDVSDLNEILQ